LIKRTDVDGGDCVDFKSSRRFNVLFAKGVEILAIRAIPNSL
jgi:hypothetical protein